MLSMIICSVSLVLAILLRFVIVPKASEWLNGPEHERMRHSEIGHV